MTKEEDDFKKVVEVGRKISQSAKEKAASFAEFLQDFGLLASEVLKEKGAEFSKATKEKTAEFAEVAAEKATEFAKAAGEKTIEFSEATSKKTSDFAKVAGEKTHEFAKATSKEFKIFTKIASKKTKEFAKTSAEATRDAAMLLRPLKPREKFEISKLADYLNENEYGLAIGWLKQGKAKMDVRKYDWSFLISGKNHVPKIISDQPYTKELNEKIKKMFLDERFKEFSERAWNAVPQYIAPNVIGQMDAKQAVALQIFSSEPMHVLFMGDAESGKSEIFESVKKLSDNSVVQASDGICVSLYEGRKVRPGGLLRAGKNLCIVHKLNNLKKEDELILYRTLETAYISYKTKSGKRRYETPASILAECSPKYGFFEKFDVEQLRKQMPLDPYLAGKFHAVIFNKKVSLERFADIAEKIIIENRVSMKQDDLDFIKKYAEFAKKLEVELPTHMADKIKEFAVVIKSREEKLPYKVTAQIIVGIIRMAKASARMELRNQIESKDLERVFNLFSKITEFQN